MRTEVRVKARIDVDFGFIAPATLPPAGPGVKQKIRGRKIAHFPNAQWDFTDSVASQCRDTGLGDSRSPAPRV